MKIEELKALVGRMTYKPGVRLTVEEGCGHFRIVARSTEPNANAPEERSTVVSAHGFSDVQLEFADEGFVVHLVRGLLRDRELHELDEWLRLDGAHVVDPHPELKPTPPPPGWQERRYHLGP